MIFGLYEVEEDERRPHRAPRASGTRCLSCPPVDELVLAVSRVSDGWNLWIYRRVDRSVTEPQRPEVKVGLYFVCCFAVRSCVGFTGRGYFEGVASPTVPDPDSGFLSRTQSGLQKSELRQASPPPTLLLFLPSPPPPPPPSPLPALELQ